MASASSLVALLGSAPLQCGQGSTADLRVEDDAPEALWLLASRFEAEGKHDAALETWATLADRYPSNRHAAESARLAGRGSARSGAADGG
jgi:cytochrome c-type biogenesis protein CcmH/NrfG